MLRKSFTIILNCCDIYFTYVLLRAWKFIVSSVWILKHQVPLTQLCFFHAYTYTYINMYICMSQKHRQSLSDIFSSSLNTFIYIIYTLYIYDIYRKWNYNGLKILGVWYNCATIWSCLLSFLSICLPDCLFGCLFVRLYFFFFFCLFASFLCCLTWD